MPKRRSLILFLLVFVSLCLVGCDEKSDNLRASMQNVSVADAFHSDSTNVTTTQGRLDSMLTTQKTASKTIEPHSKTSTTTTQQATTSRHPTEMSKTIEPHSKTATIITQQATTSQRPIKGVPEINVFSSTEYEPYTFHFSEIESAALLWRDEEQKIANEDPRLLRLLNFLAYSFNTRTDLQRQGYVKEPEIRKIFEEETPILEIVFTNVRLESGTTILERTEKIWIYEDTYLIFMNRESPGYSWATEVMADQLWPYKSLVLEGQTDIVEWIDLLSYAGF